MSNKVEITQDEYLTIMAAIQTFRYLVPQMIDLIGVLRGNGIEVPDVDELERELNEFKKLPDL